jgi:hypothetical protein
MAWHDDAIIILRVLINDFDLTDVTYEDAKLKQILVVAAHFVNKEVELEYTYTIDVEQQTISPAPTEDQAFLNLMCLKAACFILAAETKVLASQSIRVEDASAVIEVKDAYKASKELYDKCCEDYAKAKVDYTAGNLNAVKAILTPTTVHYNPTGLIFG